MMISQLRVKVVSEAALGHRYRRTITITVLTTFLASQMLPPASAHQPPGPPPNGPPPCGGGGGNTGPAPPMACTMNIGKCDVCPLASGCLPGGCNATCDDGCGCPPGKKPCGGPGQPACYTVDAGPGPGCGGNCGGGGAGSNPGINSAGNSVLGINGANGVSGGRVSPYSSRFPIYLSSGTVNESATDLELAGPGITWAQSRTYDSGLAGGAALGNRWMSNNTEMYIVSTGAGKDVFYTATAKYSFTGNDTSGYTPPTGRRLTLEYKAGTHEYWVTNLDTRTLAIFHDFTISPANDRGRLKELANVAWKAAGKTGLTYAYSYSTDVLSGLTVTTSGEQAFSVTSSFSNGRLASLSVTDGTSTLIQKIEYFYFNDVSGAHSDAGGGGDLVHVKVSSRANGDTGSTLSVVTHTLYRYAAGSRLKGVFDHAAVMRSLSYFGQTNPEWLLTQPDDHQSGGSGPKLSDFASRWFTYYSVDLKTNNSGAGTLGNPKCVTAWSTSSGENLETKYGASNRDETNFVASERVGAGQCTSCGGTSGVTHQYFYMQHSKSDDNEVKYIVVEDTSDPTGAQYRKVYGLDSDGRRLREVFIDNPNSSPKYWCQSWTLNPTSDWNNITTPKPKKRYTLSEYRVPSAHNVTSSNVAQFLDPYNAAGSGDWTNDTNTLRAASDSAAGPTFVYSYNDTGQETDKRIKRGYDSTNLYYISATDYGPGGSDTPEYLPTKSYQYPTKTTDRGTSVQWSMSYDFWDTGKLQLRKATTTYPAIATSQNGSGVAATGELWYDKAGRKRWAKNAEGYITYYSYEKTSGQWGYTAVDVNPSSLPSSATSGTTVVLANDDGDGDTTYDSAGIPSRDGGLPTPVALVTQQLYDSQGRPTVLTGPGGDRHVTVYKSDRTIQFPFLDTSGYPQMPIQVQAFNDEGQVTETYEVKADYSNIDVTSSVPTGFSTDPGQADYVAWTRNAYDSETGNLTQVDTYHNIPSSGTGTISANFYRTVFQYDVQGRRTYAIQQVSGAPTSGNNGVEQVTQTIYDKFDRVTEVKRGVSSASHNMGANYDTYPTLATVSKTYYDAGDDTTPLKVGDGYASSMKNFFGTGASDYVESIYKRTYRGVLRGAERTNSGTPLSPSVVMDIDWGGRNVGAALYASSVTWSDVLTGDGYTDYLSGHSTNRNGLTKTNYDDLSHIFRTEHYFGAEVSKHIEINKYYDRMGRLVAMGDKYSANTEYAYDGAGRQYQQRAVLKLVDDNATYGKFTSGGIFNYRAPKPNPNITSSTGGNDGLIEVNHSIYGTASGGDVEQVVTKITVELNHNDTNGINSGSPYDFVARSVHQWFDGAHRLIATGDSGSGGSGWTIHAFPSRPSLPTGSSSSLLATLYAYDPSTGLPTMVTDANGSKTKTFYDHLGRKTFAAENYDNFTPPSTNIGDSTDGSKDRVSKWEYNATGRITSLTAYNGSNATSDTQITRYLFEDAYSASLVTSTIYPESTDTTSSGTDQVKVTYNLDGTPATRTDQRGVVAAFAYDSARRLIAEKVTSFGSSGIVDDTIKSITRKYDDFGRRLKITSHNNATDDPDNTTSIANQIVYSNGTEGFVTKSEQSHTGAVTMGTPAVQYAYDDSATSNVYTNALRVSSVTYPGASRVTYNDYGSDDSISDRLNRVYRVRASNSSGTILTEYAYNGTRRLVSADYPTPAVKLDLFQGTSGTYAGFDQFGRTVRQEWDKYGSGSGVRDRVDYSYDYAGNRLTRDVRVDLINSGYTDARDQKYSYDGIERLQDYNQGTWSGTAITSSNKQRSWKLDQLGNWTQTYSDLSQTTSEQTRAHNEANELTAIDSVSTHVAEDAAGNMTKIPKATSWSAHFDLKYDAWNRLVQVKDGANTVQENQYDGLGRRIVRSIYASGSLSYRIHYYYNENWQLLEERKEVGGTEASNPLNQYVRHPYYVDALAIRYYDEDTDGSGIVDYYYLHDANFNITGVVGSSGSVAERYAYSPYGDLTVLDDNFAADSDGVSDIGNTHFFTGREFDSETGLQLNRNRYYASHLGRWINRDPEDYIDGMNLYQYVSSKPTISTDPFGLITREQCEKFCDDAFSLCTAAGLFFCGEYCASAIVCCLGGGPWGVLICCIIAGKCMWNCMNTWVTGCGTVWAACRLACKAFPPAPQPPPPTPEPPGGPPPPGQTACI